jgi:hypothetical protein
MLEQSRTMPLRGGRLIGVTVAVWVTGAAYCSGYEKLLSGLDNWPGSLLWSAVAVLPWLALFEWSKTELGRSLAGSPLRLMLALVATAALSLTLEAAVDALSGSSMASLALSILRRLPAAGLCIVLVLWSRAGLRTQSAAVEDENLSAIAASIDWVGAADNYVELHIGGRTVTRRMTMREAERALAPHGFVRIHRRFLVNRRRIENLGSNGEREITLADGGRLPIGRAFAANLNHTG